MLLLLRWLKIEKRSTVSSIYRKFCQQQLGRNIIFANLFSPKQYGLLRQKNLRHLPSPIAQRINHANTAARRLKSTRTRQAMGTDEEKDPCPCFKFCFRSSRSAKVPSGETYRVSCIVPGARAEGGRGRGCAYAETPIRIFYNCSSSPSLGPFASDQRPKRMLVRFFNFDGGAGEMRGASHVHVLARPGRCTQPRGGRPLEADEEKTYFPSQLWCDEIVMHRAE